MGSDPSRSNGVIIGRSFDDSISTLRLAESGFRVAVMEQGRRALAAELEATPKGPLP